MKSSPSSNIKACWVTMNKLFCIHHHNTGGCQAPRTALAHPGHDVATGAIAGLMHPVTGIDHLIFLVGAGVAGANQRARPPRSRGCDGCGTCRGALLGLIGVQLPALDWVIAASVVAVGVALAMAPFAGGRGCLLARHCSRCATALRTALRRARREAPLWPVSCCHRCW